MLSLTTTQNPVFLKDSVEKRHYKLARLLIGGGTRLLREKFDSIYKPENLALTLNDPAMTRKLKELLTDQEWNYLDPQNPGKYCTSSANFDFWLTLKLLRTICGLTRPVTGWYTMPHGFSFEEDLARLECYCSSICYQEMTDANFIFLWKAISEAFLRIAGGISSEKRNEWEISIEEYLGEYVQDAITSTEVNEYLHQMYIRSTMGIAEIMRRTGDAIYESCEYM